MSLLVRECKFCGSDDIIANHRRDCTGDRVIQVCCGSCGGKAPATGSLDSALMAWNGLHGKYEECSVKVDKNSHFTLNVSPNENPERIIQGMGNHGPCQIIVLIPEVTQ